MKNKMRAFNFLLIMAILTATSVAIISPIASYPAQAQRGKKVFTKVSQVAKKLCELGGCWYIVEEVIEYFTQDNQGDNSVCNNAPGKGCTIRTGGGNITKIGERRRTISKTRIR
jgi:hypothetical protein